MKIRQNHSDDLILALHLRSSAIEHELRRAVQALDLIRDLGGNGVRFDLSWFDIAPEKNRWDASKVAWYREFFREAVRGSGFTPIVVLIGAPRWARVLFRNDRRAFLAHWRAYCERAVEIMDGHVRLIQVWNEVNNPILQIADPTNPPPGLWNQSFLYELLHTTSALLRPAIKPLELIINITADLPRWEPFVSECIRRAGASFDIIGLDYYAGLYWPARWRDVQCLVRALERVNDPHDLWYGKQAALIEFGFPTFLPYVRDEARQQEWAAGVLETVRAQNQNWRARDGKSLRLLSWYELFDEPVQMPFGFLGRFGVVRQPNGDGVFQRKPAFYTLREHLRALRDGDASYHAPNDFGI